MDCLFNDTAFHGLRKKTTKKVITVASDFEAFGGNS